jgi:hypothetical protein
MNRTIARKRVPSPAYLAVIRTIDKFTTVISS